MIRSWQGAARQSSLIAAGRRGMVVALVAIAACSRWAEPPRYGSLKRDDGRRFDFAHGIQLFEVGNGLRFALLPDARTDLATVDIRYDVGAKDDPPGRAGMAHLVEHLMFEFRPTAGGPTLWDQFRATALETNAWTTWDATHYSATVPIERLDEVIALEGRMLTATCDQLDDATLARERDVVLAENRERGPDDGALYRAIYGDAHPYARPISSDEIAQATRAEVCAFIGAHYAPGRASLVVTGDFAIDHVRQVVGRTFGPIKRTATAPVLETPAPRLAGQTTRLVADVEHPTAVVAFAAPPFGTSGVAASHVARALLASVLERADDEAGWILDTDVQNAGDDRAPVMLAVVTVRDAAQLEAAADEIYARAERLFDAGAFDTSYLRSLMALGYMEAWDDTRARGEWLTRFMQLSPYNQFMLGELRGLDQPWPELMKGLEGAFTPPRSHRVLITPGGAHGDARSAVLASAHDVHVWRQPVDAAEADRPLTTPPARPGRAVTRHTLANGLVVELAPDPTAAIIDARLVFPVGTADGDPAHPLVASAAAQLLEFDAEGYYTGPELEKFEWALSRGTVPEVDVDELTTTFAVRGLAHYADWHVWWLSALLDRGRYNDVTLDAVHRYAQRLQARAADDDAHGTGANQPALQVFLERLFGAGHPFTRPPVKLGPAYQALTAGQLATWKGAHYRPRGATLIVSGNFDAAAMRREVDELFGPWADVAPAPRAAIPAARPTPAASWLAIENRDASQLAATLAFPLADAPARQAARTVIAAMLSDELRDVREGMGASYGVRAELALPSVAGGALLVTGHLDEGLADRAVTRILASVARLRTDAAARRTAFIRARRAVFTSLRARAAGVAAVAQARVRAFAAGTDGDADAALAREVAALRLDDVAAVLTEELAPARMVAVLAGRMPVVDAAFAAIGQTPERLLEPAAPAHDPARDQPQPRRPVDADAPVDVGPPVEALAVDRWDEEGERHDGLYQGQTRLSLDGFLAIAGRDDLRDRMRRRWWLRVGLAAAGAVTIGGGVYHMLDARSCDGVIDLPGGVHEDQACLAERDNQRSAGGVIILGGVVFEVAAYYISNLAPSKAELRQAASRYNYRHRLRGAAASHDLRIRPTTDGQTTGLTVSGTF